MERLFILSQEYYYPTYHGAQMSDGCHYNWDELVHEELPFISKNWFYSIKESNPQIEVGSAFLRKSDLPKLWEGKSLTAKGQMAFDEWVKKENIRLDFYEIEVEPIKGMSDGPFAVRAFSEEDAIQRANIIAAARGKDKRVLHWVPIRCCGKFTRRGNFTQLG